MSTQTRSRARSWGDVAAAACGVGLFAVAAVTGAILHLAGRPVRAGAAPLSAHWLPHLGPGTPLALTVAVLVVWHGPVQAARLPWRRVLLATYAAAVAWTLTLALVDGWHRGLAGRLTTPPEYLHDIGRVPDIPTMMRTFTSRILDFQSDSWTTHVAGHPPGAFLVFLGLDRLGLGGGGWAALACVLAGALVAVAVPQTMRLLGDEAAARAAVPFLVLFPGAVWMGASADGLFAGITAAGVALLAHGLARGNPATALAGGAVVALGAYLSYGLVLLAAVVLATVIAGRRYRLLPWSLLGAAAVMLAFTAAGFWWLDGYHLVVERYHQGIASDRAYLYWVWANLATLTVSAGPAAVVIIRRAVTDLRARVPDRVLSRPIPVAALLPLAAAVAIVAADLSGLSKAEVERIWLPFGVWLMAGAALLPTASRRPWLAAQALTAILVNHLLLTTW